MKTTGAACWPFSSARCLRCTAERASVAHGQEEGEEAARNVGLASGFAGLMARLAEGDAYYMFYTS